MAMIVGVPKEIKAQENRVGLLPSAAYQLIQRGHKVLVEKGAGVGSGYPDEEYTRAGAELVAKHAEVFERAGMIVKVKEPLPEEYGLLRENQILFTYLHLAASKPLTEALVKSRVTGIAYETVEGEAEQQNIAIADHAAHLVVHGMLHLLGYDHEQEDDAVKMETLETEILATLGIADPYGNGDAAGLRRVSP